MTWTARYPNLLPVNSTTGGQAWMQGWTNATDGGDGSAVVASGSPATSSTVPVTAGSTYLFAVTLDPPDLVQGGNAADSGDDFLDGGNAAGTGIDSVDGGDAYGGMYPGRIGTYALEFRNASNTVVAATTTSIGSLVGDRAVWFAVAPATAATVAVKFTPAGGSLYVKHPILIQGVSDPGPLDPVSTPDGGLAAVEIDFQVTATASKTSNAVAVASITFGTSGISGEAAFQDSAGEIGIEFDVSATAEYGKSVNGAAGIAFNVRATAVKGLPVPVREAAGDVQVSFSATATSAKTSNVTASTTIAFATSAVSAAFRDSTGGGFDWQLVAYQPGSATPYPLPHPTAFTASMVLSDVGAMSLEYPLDGVNAYILNGYCDVEFQVRTGTTYVTPPNGRFCVTDMDPDFVTERERPTRRYTLQSYGGKLGQVVQLQTFPLDANGERAFGNSTIASIVKTIITEEKAAGNIPGLQFDNAAANTKRLPLAYPPGKDVLSILREQTDTGNCEWLIEKNASGNEARTLTMYDSIGSDRSAGNNPVRLVEGTDIASAPSKVTYQGLAGKVMVIGDDGRVLTFTNAGADTPYGVGTTVVQAGGITDLAALQIIGQARLDKGAKPRAQLTRDIIFSQDAKWLPFQDYGLGDKILAQNQDGDFASLRVRQVTITYDKSKGLSGNLVLNDRLVEGDIALARQVKRLSGSGNATSGSGRAPIPAGTDKRQIKPPTNLAVTSLPYLDGSTPKARITAGWINPTKATDDTAMDPSQTELWGRPNSVGEKFKLLGTADFPDSEVSDAPYAAASAWQFKVKSVGTNGKKSDFSNVATVTLANDSTPPPRPSPPDVDSRMGQLSVGWDGTFAGGAPTPADFNRVELHASGSSGFTVSAGTWRDSFTGPGSHVFTNVPYGSARFFKLVAVDQSGNVSQPSAQSQGVTAALVDTDLIGQIVDGAKIKDGTLNASDKVVANSITGREIKSLTIDTGHLRANAITADKIDVGAVTASAISAAALNGKTITGSLVRTSAGPSRVELNDNGIYQYRSNTAVSTITAAGWNLRSSTTGARIEVSSTGVRLYNGSGRATVNLKSNGDASFEGAITASTITGSTITGGTVRTSTSSTRIELTSTGLRQYKGGEVLTELTSAGGFVFRSASDGERLTISPGIGIQAFNSAGTRTVLIGVNGTASFRGTVTSSNITNSTVGAGTVVSGATVQSSSGSGNNWSGGKVRDASVTGGSVSGTSVSGSTIQTSPYWAGSSGAGVGIGAEAADSGSQSTTMVIRAGGTRVGYVAGYNTSGGAIIVIGQSGNARAQYFSTGAVNIRGSSTVTVDSPRLRYTGALEKVSLRATKKKIRPITDLDVAALLEVQPVTYVPRGGTTQRYAGLIAEDLELRARKAKGLHVLLAYDEDRKLSGVKYSEFGIFNLAINRYQQKRIDSLSRDLDSALERITTLEAAR